MPFTQTNVAVVRHVVQRILVPCVFVIGLLGNSVSIYVLTRKRMRCTTNIYLTALAITDIIYLAMALLLSLKHYDYMQRYCEPYWMFYGMLVWLCDACAYISIYIAVCFTIERFIAIRYPLKRQTFCTESLAKNVIAGVALFCLLSTISTAFEHQYGVQTKLIDSYGEPCNSTMANMPGAPPLPTTPTTRRPTVTPQAPMAAPAVTTVEQPTERLHHWPADGSGGGDVAHHIEKLLLQSTDNNGNNNNSTVMQYERREGQGSSLKASIPRLAITRFTTASSWDVLSEEQFLDAGADELEERERILSKLHMELPTTPAMQEPFVLQSQTKILQPAKQQLLTAVADDQQLYGSVKEPVTDFNITFYCENVTYYQNTYSSLAQNALYTRIWYFFTLFVFVVIPLCVLATFNCFLIMLVRRSKSLRGEMTNASSMRRPKRKSVSSVSQENRVTVTLIAVVLLFIVCQLPWAIYLIVSEQMDIDVNLQAIFGNIFNFLAAINAAANFFLYCVLSDKYRKTVRELITRRRNRYHHSQRSQMPHMHTSLYSHPNNNNNNNSTTFATTLNGSGTGGGGGGGGSRRYRAPATSIVIK